MIITGTKVWTLEVRGVVPPGTDPALIEPTIHANYAITGTLIPFVRATRVIVRDATPDDHRSQ